MIFQAVTLLSTRSSTFVLMVHVQTYAMQGQILAIETEGANVPIVANDSVGRTTHGLPDRSSELLQ